MKPLAALAALWLAGTSCSYVEYDPPSLVNKFRVLGVRAEPPVIGTFGDATVTTLVAGHAVGEKLCHAWAFCPFAWAKDENFRCVDPDVQIDLGTAAAATVGLQHVIQAMQNADKVFKKLGMDQPTASGTLAGKAPDLGCIPGGQAPDSSGSPIALAQGFDLPETYLLFTIGEARTWGGTCPATASEVLAKACPNRATCVAGYKRLAVSLEMPCGAFDPAAEPLCTKPPRSCARKLVCGCDGKTYWNDCERVAAKIARKAYGACPNRNPHLQDLWLAHEGGATTDAAVQAHAIAWPADVTPVVAPGAALDLLPGFAPGDLEDVGPSIDPAKTSNETENLVFSWFSTAGTFDRQRSHDARAANVFRAPVTVAGDLTVTLWIVARDGRNGTDWVERRLIVRQGATAQGNPVCAAKPGSQGCAGR